MSETTSKKRPNRRKQPARANPGAKLFAKLKTPLGLIVGAVVLFGAIWGFQAAQAEPVELPVETVEVTDVPTVEADAEAEAPSEEKGMQGKLSKAWDYLRGDSSAIVAEADADVEARLAQVEILEAQVSSDQDRMIEMMDEVEQMRQDAASERVALVEMRSQLVTCVNTAMGGGQ